VLPIRDDIPSSRFPALTLGIIALNSLVFFEELRLGPRLQDFMLQYGIIPARYTVPDIARLFSFPEQVIALFTSMFLHGGWLHLIGNMWILWIFGDNVEDRLGRVRFLALYLVGGIAAALVHIVTNAGSPVPTIGASGAIAAVMGAYFRFYPFAKVQTLIPPFFNGALSLGMRGGPGFSGVAWWAHVGGFMFGFLVCLPAPRNKRRNS
jgi:membrane associated rhomboid family serine protease